MATTAQSGDKPRVAQDAIVASFPMSVVDEADVNDVSSAVNNALLSGKAEGSMYVMKETTGSELIIIIAAGPATTDVWWRQDALGTGILPA